MTVAVLYGVNWRTATRGRINGGDSVLTTFESRDESLRYSSYEQIENIALPGYDSEYFHHFELTNTGYRLWNDDTEYNECRTALSGTSTRTQAIPILPIGFLALDPDNCDYSDAADFDGFGWNQVTMSSCPPLISDGTDNESGIAVDNADVDNTQTSLGSDNSGLSDTQSGGGSIAWALLIFLLAAGRERAFN